MKKIIMLGALLILSSCSGKNLSNTDTTPRGTPESQNSGSTIAITPENQTVHQISKITHSVGGMFGSTTIEITPGNITMKSSIEKMNASGTLDASDWKKLIDSIDIDTFIALNQKDERFACKACAYDGDNMESLTIEYATGTKTLSYGSQNTIAELKRIRVFIATLSKTIAK